MPSSSHNFLTASSLPSTSSILPIPSTSSLFLPLQRCILMSTPAPSSRIFLHPPYSLHLLPPPSPSTLHPNVHTRSLLLPHAHTTSSQHLRSSLLPSSTILPPIPSAYPAASTTSFSHPSSSPFLLLHLWLSSSL